MNETPEKLEQGCIRLHTQTDTDHTEADWTIAPALTLSLSVCFKQKGNIIRHVRVRINNTSGIKGSNLAKGKRCVTRNKMITRMLGRNSSFRCLSEA